MKASEMFEAVEHGGVLTLIGKRVFRFIASNIPNAAMPGQEHSVLYLYPQHKEEGFVAVKVYFEDNWEVCVIPVELTNEGMRLQLRVTWLPKKETHCQIDQWGINFVAEGVWYTTHEGNLKKPGFAYVSLDVACRYITGKATIDEVKDCASLTTVPTYDALLSLSELQQLREIEAARQLELVKDRK